MSVSTTFEKPPFEPKFYPKKVQIGKKNIPGECFDPPRSKKNELLLNVPELHLVQLALADPVTFFISYLVHCATHRSWKNAALSKRPAEEDGASRAEKEGDQAKRHRAEGDGALTARVLAAALGSRFVVVPSVDGPSSATHEADPSAMGLVLLAMSAADQIQPIPSIRNYLKEFEGVVDVLRNVGTVKKAMSSFAEVSRDFHTTGLRIATKELLGRFRTPLLRPHLADLGQKYAHRLAAFAEVCATTPRLAAGSVQTLITRAADFQKKTHFASPETIKKIAVLKVKFQALLDNPPLSSPGTFFIEETEAQNRYARLSAVAYSYGYRERDGCERLLAIGTGGAPFGYKIDETLSTGDFVILHSSEEGGREVVMSFRGSDRMFADFTTLLANPARLLNIADWVVNCYVPFGKLEQTARYAVSKSAIDVVAEKYAIPKNEIVFTGHSQGGAFAARFAEVYGATAHVYNPGSDIFSGEADRNVAVGCVVNCYRTYADVVSAGYEANPARQHVRMTRLTAKTGTENDLFAQHALSQFFQEKKGFLYAERTSNVRNFLGFVAGLDSRGLCLRWLGLDSFGFTDADEIKHIENYLCIREHAEISGAVPDIIAALNNVEVIPK